jgi:murein DD-endopeptidase MepM/ murein hydrolase activator NlpD
VSHVGHIPPASLGATTPTASKPDDAHVAGKQLEAFFMRQLLTEAQPEGGGSLDGGFAGDTFKQMFNEAIADKMSAGHGIGLSEMFAKQLEKKDGSSPHPAISALHPSASPSASPISTANTNAPVPGLEDAPHFILPVKGTPTSGYGDRIDPIKGTKSTHPGFDLAANVGTPVSAAAAGTIVHAGPAGTYGNLVTIRHDAGYETRYAHLSQVSVKVGDRVEAGANVGAVGTTGYSTGPHLHFEVRHEGTTVDPAPLLPLNRSKPRTIR